VSGRGDIGRDTNESDIGASLIAISMMEMIITKESMRWTHINLVEHW